MLLTYKLTPFHAVATKIAATMPITVSSNLSGSDITNDSKGYMNSNKVNKKQTSRNGLKKARKSLLQEQQEVLEKNGKVGNDSLRDINEGCKAKDNFMNDGDSAPNDLRAGAGGMLGGSGSHPRNRWRCMQPRVCNYCWKTFSNSFNLKQHIVNVHVQSQGVSCSLCEKVVKNKWYLRKHLVTAHGAPLKRVKGNENGGSSLGTRETNTDAVSKQVINDQTETIDAAAVAAAAAAANIPLASFVAAANSISQQHNNNINNNISISTNPTIHASGHVFPFSAPSFITDSSAKGTTIGMPDATKGQELSKVTSTKEFEINTEEDTGEDEEEELIVDG